MTLDIKLADYVTSSGSKDTRLTGKRCYRHGMMNINIDN